MKQALTKTPVEDRESLIEDYRRFKALRPIFIGGLGRSGTTLMLRLLDGHPKLLVYPRENKMIHHLLMMDVLPSFNAPAFLKAMAAKDFETISSLLFNTAVANRLWNPLRVYLLAEDLGNRFKSYLFETLSSISERWSASEVVMSFLFSYFKTAGAGSISQYQGWVSKCPDGGHCLTAYNMMFPDALMIHLIRDPRATYASLCLKNLRLPRERRELKCGAIFNVLDIADTYRTAFARVNRVDRHRIENLLLVRYEDIIQFPERTMRKVSDFLGIAFDNILLRPTLMNQPCAANSSFSLERIPSGKIFVDSLARWRHLMRWYERWLIEARLAEELIEYGYEDRIRFRPLKTFTWLILWYFQAWFRRLISYKTVLLNDRS